MSAEKPKQPAVGDRGQRYEIWCDDEDGKPMQMGWSNNPESMKRAVELHPCWSNHRAVDRLGAAAVKSESAPDVDGTAFDSSAWLGELEAALTHAENAYKARVPDETVPDHDALRCAVNALREILRAARRHSPNDVRMSDGL